MTFELQRFEPGTLLKLKPWNKRGHSYAFLHRIVVLNSETTPGSEHYWRNDPPIMYVACVEAKRHLTHLLLHKGEIFKITLSKAHNIHEYFEVANESR